MGNIQQLDWGSIDWIFEPEPGSNDHMKVGISRMRPGSVQPLHVHSGDEQIAYIISGRGRQTINNEDVPIEPGRICHIGTGMSHETVNDGDTDIVKLLVSVPASLRDRVPLWRRPLPEPWLQARIDPKAFLRQTVQEISRQMLDPLRLPVAIYDAEGERVYRNQEYPSFCRSCCAVAEDERTCPLYREGAESTLSSYTRPLTFVCQYGLSLYVQPIICDAVPLGCIRAGHVRTAAAKAEYFPAELPYNVPSSTVMGILQIMEKLCECICNHYWLALMEKNLEDSRRELNDQRAREQLLQSSLRTSQNRTVNLRLNQHFLANTLNMILSMAIREGAEQTYSAVSSLALLLQYTFRHDRYFVSLREEVDYLRNYTDLQKMRFGKRLRVRYQVDSTLLGEDVPFNFLQPIVENCFHHGFASMTGIMRLSVLIQPNGNEIQIQISDNGCGGLDEAKLCALCAAAERDAPDHGITMVIRKLNVLYGGRYQYSVQSGETGTCVTIRIPRRTGGGGGTR